MSRFLVCVDLNEDRCTKETDELIGQVEEVNTFGSLADEYRGRH